MKSFSHKLITAEESGIIIELASKTWYVTYEEVHSREQLDYMFTKMYQPDKLLSAMSEGETFFAGYCEGTPFGYFSVKRKEKDLFYLQKLYILPEWQGKGAGKYLFLSAVAYIKELHPSPCILELNVNRKNKAIYFYQGMGMEVVAESDDEIGNGFVMNNCFMQMNI